MLADLASAPRIEHALTHPYPESLKQAVDQARDPACRMSAADWAVLDARLGDAFTEAALALIESAQIDPETIRAIGSHGQTLSHQPDADPPATLQLGDPHRIAQGTGIVTVADFRRADLAAGGQAAPLAPIIHDVLFRDRKENRAILNLGGIANLTLLPADGPTRAFDTGPANCLLDFWYQRHQGGRYDPGGRWAAGGRSEDALLKVLLDDPYFEHPPPKSTGIEQFGAAWLDRCLTGFDLHPADVQATLIELTAATIAQSLASSSDVPPDHLLVAGGGVHNETLMDRLTNTVSPIPVETTAAHGIDPEFIEALLFAHLARERLADRPVDTRTITGAKSPVKLGTVHSPL